MAAMWAVALTLLADLLLIVGVVSGFAPASIFGIRELVALTLRALIVGAMAGALFAMAVSRTGRRATLDSLSTTKVVAWSFLGTASIIPFLAIALGAMLPVSVLIAGTLLFGMLGAVMGAATLRIGRRAPERALGRVDEQTLLPPSA